MASERFAFRDSRHIQIVKTRIQCPEPEPQSPSRTLKQENVGKKKGCRRQPEPCPLFGSKFELALLVSREIGARRSTRRPLPGTKKCGQFQQRSVQYPTWKDPDQRFLRWVSSSEVQLIRSFLQPHFCTWGIAFLNVDFSMVASTSLKKRNPSTPIQSFLCNAPPPHPSLPHTVDTALRVYVAAFSLKHLVFLFLLGVFAKSSNGTAR